MRAMVVIAGIWSLAAIVFLYMQYASQRTMLETQAERIDQLQAQLAESLEKAREAGERPPPKVRWVPRKPDVPPQPAHDGRVLAVDLEANVCVISLGGKDGVEKGFQYIVSRGADYVATIEINDVQAKQSAGFAIKELSKSDIQRGDRVMNGR